MKAENISICQEVQTAPLDDMVNKIIEASSIAASRNRNLIINDVPAEMIMVADKNILSSIISKLLHAMLKHARDTSIRISAKRYNNIVLVHVKDSNGCNNQGINYGVQQAQPLATRIGGFLDITSSRHRETTVSFSFPNVPDTGA